MLDGDGNCCFPVKGHPACQHFKKRNSQRINIALFIAVAAPRLLRGSIMYTSHYVRGNGIAGRCLCNTEIRYLYLAVLGNNDILGFDVPVDNMIVMGSLDSHADLNCNADSLLIGKARLFFNIFFQGNPFHQFHDNIINAVFLTDIVYIDNIWMHQSCCRLRLYPEL